MKYIKKVYIKLNKTVIVRLNRFPASKEQKGKIEMLVTSPDQPNVS